MQEPWSLQELPRAGSSLTMYVNDATRSTALPNVTKYRVYFWHIKPPDL